LCGKKAFAPVKQKPGPVKKPRRDACPAGSKLSCRPNKLDFLNIETHIRSICTWRTMRHLSSQPKQNKRVSIFWINSGAYRLGNYRKKFSFLEGFRG
jgi:hypothetical protein